MCCFSRNVEDVSNTRIYARLMDGRQAIVYAMQLTAGEDLAMVLPIPTPPASAEDAVTFVNLEDYPKFFEDMAKGFPQPRSREWKGPPTLSAPAEGPLAVHEVGAYEASFVPAIRDFGRLDERFRLPEQVWETVPDYADYGFAVFKLKEGERQEVHPMAFTFPTRHPDRVFFPTVHIHDGTLPREAHFDHTLYCQLPEGRGVGGDFASTWTESPDHARAFVKIEKTKELVLPDRHCYRQRIHAHRTNRDVLVDLA